MSEGSNATPVTEKKQSPAGQFWSGLSRPTRLIMGAAAFVIVCALFFFIFGQKKTPLEVLFSGLEPGQAEEVLAVLEEQRIPFDTADEGATILVPREQRDRLRIKLSPDLYAQGKGFALFEAGGLIASDFERRVQWQIALEEELRRTITSLDSIKQARVHLVIPEDGVFMRDRGVPTAAIFVRLEPLASLTDQQVRGILTMVAGSVEGLLPENVTIIDARGNVLFDAFQLGEKNSPQHASSQIELQRGFERELEYRLRTLLERIYGPGKAVAMVSAELDFETRERTTVTYSDPVNRSEQHLEEWYEGTAGLPLEVGEPNIPGYAAETGAGDYEYERIEDIINYEVGETREYIASAPGQVKRLSAAVILDRPASEETAERIAALVASAIGLDDIRGDIVSVQCLPFDTSWQEGWEEEPAVPAPAGRFTLRPLHLVAAAVALGLLLFLGVVLVRRSRAAHLQDMELFREGMIEEAAAEEKPAPPEQKKHEQVRQMAEDEPEDMAQVLRTWLAQE